jgi:hypothetical protein
MLSNLLWNFSKPALLVCSCIFIQPSLLFEWLQHNSDVLDSLTH